MVLFTKYHGSRPCSFRREDLFMFSLYKLCKICDPEAGSVWLQEHNSNKNGMSPLGDAIDQISRL